MYETVIWVALVAAVLGLQPRHHCRHRGLQIPVAARRPEGLGHHDGLLRDARASFYREAFDWVAPYLVDGVHRTDLGPTRAGENVARGAVLHGYDLASELDGVIQTAQRTLTACLVLAGSRTASPKGASLVLSAWRDRQRRAITTRCKLSLGDSARALLWAAEQALAGSP